MRVRRTSLILPVTGVLAAGVAAAGGWFARDPSTTGGGVTVVAAGAAPSRAAATPARAAANDVSATFTVSNADIENPERGFYSWGSDRLETLTADDVADAITRKQRLLFVLLRLDAYRTGTLPSSYLANLQKGFDNARNGGVKLIIRGVYNYPENETQYKNAKDASLSQVRAHLEQLKPLFTNNSDVIAYMQAGFVGAWGEWHTSSNNLTTPSNRAQVKDAILAALPASRFVQFRYPPHLQGWAPNLPGIDSALSGSFRLGFHNDCFLASVTDVGTYSEDAATRNQERAYIAKLTELAPFGGETCNPADEEGAVSRTACSDILGEGAQYHLTYLNEDYYTERFHVQWKNSNCLDTVRKKMGYRFELSRASHAAAARRGSSFAVTLGVRNTGWARLYNARPLQVVLRGANGQTRRLVASGIDPRRWLPGAATSDVSASVQIPGDLPAGSYRVLVALPDASSTLAAKPLYAIRFANADVGAQQWDAAIGAFATGTSVQVQ